MNMAVVGAARVVFGADTSDFDAGAKGVEGTLGRLIEKFGEVERRIKQVGAGMTLGITVPFLAMTRAVDKGAGSFEGQMKRVEAALGNVSGHELKALSDQARELGPKVGKGATEAASAIEALGLAGVATADILGGALKAALDLSAAGMVDAESSAALVTDIMGQFKVSAEQLPGVVQKVVGALDTSKFGFDDFRLAVGQGGSVAAAAGVGFLDFATAISATSTQFTSGADAGTSFKTYIQSLTGKSKQAQQAMDALGISFFDANGQMKPVAEQAQMLRDKLGNLTDKSKSDALETIFGSDAARTAIGLMEQGADGFNKLQEAIAGGDVEAKIQKRLEGSEAAGQRIANAWESVKIALGVDTGFLDLVTAIKNGFATLLEKVAHAPPVFLQIGAAFSALGAVIGPLIVAVTHLGAMFLAHFAASRFGMIGKAIALVLSPISTLMGLLGEMGLARVLAMAGSRLLALLGPVGVAISLFMLFKDQIVTALQAVWKSFSETLGPPLEAIIAKVGAIFAKLSGGEIGSALQGLMTLLGGVKEVIGTVLVGAIRFAGEVIERVLAAAIAIISGFVDVVSGVVDAVSALLRGDFAGAWEAMGSIVEAVWDTLISVIAAFVPEISAELSAVYEAAKQWLVDGFQSIVGSFTGIVQSGVNAVSNAFPNVVAAAKAVYQGVKGWLVDKFGGIMTWIGKAAKWIGDQYAGLKNMLGLGGGSAQSSGSAAPPAPQDTGAPTGNAPKQSVTLDGGGGGSKKSKKTGSGSGHKAKERDPAKDAADRAQIEQDVAMDAARLRGDIATEQAMRRQLELARQIEAYQRTGLSLEAATAAAKKDMAILDEARREGLAKELEEDAQAHKIELARISGNRTMEESLERQRELKQRIDRFLRDGLSMEEATARALQQQLEIDEARAQVRKQLLLDEEQDRQLALAKARGESEERIRMLQREIDIRNRQRELERDGMDSETAKTQAGTEWDEMEKARQTGVFRETFKDGVRAALDGDLKGWLKNFWQDRIAKGMEAALNSLADLISQLFANVGRSSGGGGGIFGAIASVVGGVFGGGGSKSINILGADTGPMDVSGLLDNTFSKTPGFKTGGSFKVGGRSGIDANLVSFRASKGELVNIQRPGNDAGPQGSIHVEMHMPFTGAVDLATKTEAVRWAEAARVAAIQGISEAQRRRG